MSNKVCIFCSRLPRGLRDRKPLPGTVRHYQNFKPENNRRQRPQIRFRNLTEKRDAEAEDADPTALPMSPIMNQEEWAARYKRPTKPPPPLLHEMSEQSKELLRNPYARALSEPIRQDFYYLFRLPRSFLIPITSRINPETKEPWILPYGIKAADKGIKTPKPKRYALASLDYLKHMGLAPRRWVKARNPLMGVPGEAVWREDMGDFVLKQLRRRVAEEVASVKSGLDFADEDGGEWMSNKRIGCVLLWRRPKEIAADDQQAPSSQSNGTEKLDPELPEAVYPPRTSMELTGRKVPVYDMNTMLGDKLAAELKEKLLLKNEVGWRFALIFSAVTINAHQWLLKLSGYISRDDAT